LSDMVDALKHGHPLNIGENLVGKTRRLQSGRYDTNGFQYRTMNYIRFNEIFP